MPWVKERSFSSNFSSNFFGCSCFPGPWSSSLLSSGATPGGRNWSRWVVPETGHSMSPQTAEGSSWISSLSFEDSCLCEPYMFTFVSRYNDCLFHNLPLLTRIQLLICYKSESGFEERVDEGNFPIWPLYNRLFVLEWWRLPLMNEIPFLQFVSPVWPGHFEF